MSRERRPPRTLGPLHQPFWDACARGEFHLPRCTGCGRWSWPPAPTCDQCNASLAWRPASGRGRLFSHCTFHQDYYGGLLPLPWEVILVELEEGVLFVANPLGFRPAEVPLGYPLAVRFLDCEDEHGPFRLPVFAPLTAHRQTTEDAP